mmetsp:Transcript_2795/g.7065  ORF Transcript_2795/g.7065 Transcript_2795/m.7065 type:complete len:221 (-) Transcript_2795:968-1630(-)
MHQHRILRPPRGVERLLAHDNGLPPRQPSGHPPAIAAIGSDGTAEIGSVLGSLLLDPLGRGLRVPRVDELLLCGGPPHRLPPRGYPTSRIGRCLFLRFPAAVIPKLVQRILLVVPIDCAVHYQQIHVMIRCVVPGGTLQPQPSHVFQAPPRSAKVRHPPVRQQHEPVESEEHSRARLVYARDYRLSLLPRERVEYPHQRHGRRGIEAGRGLVQQDDGGIR